MLETARRSLDVGGRHRTYVLVTDRQADAKPSGKPLVVFFHGTGQSGGRMRRFSGRSFDRLSATIGAVVVYPDGYRHDWNGARFINTPAQRDGIDDVAFFNRLVDELVESEHVDPTRVFVVGFSLGGQMVFRLLHDAPERLAGAGIISSTQPAPDIFVSDRSDEGSPVPIVLFHGTKDPLAPYHGGPVSVYGLFSRGPHLSVPDTAAYYARRNGHSTPPIVRKHVKADGASSETVTATIYGAESAAPVMLLSIEGGGHQVPNPNHVPTRWFWGHSTPDLNCAEVIADLLARKDA